MLSLGAPRTVASNVFWGIPFIPSENLFNPTKEAGFGNLPPLGELEGSHLREVSSHIQPSGAQCYPPFGDSHLASRFPEIWRVCWLKGLRPNFKFNRYLLNACWSYSPENPSTRDENGFDLSTITLNLTSLVYMKNRYMQMPPCQPKRVSPPPPQATKSV